MRNERKAQERYRRRHEKRVAKKTALCSSYDSFDEVFTYSHLSAACSKCCKGVLWKSSVQAFIANKPLKLSMVLSDLRSGKYRSSGFHEFDIVERGKKRHIQSVSFQERIVQRCLCEYSLVPMLSRKFIYDNAASIRGKGYSFSIKRLTEHLHGFYRKNRTDGFVLTLDFSNYFGTIRHEYIKELLMKEYTDERLINLIFHFIDCFEGDTGLGLGSQVSQILALFNANALDHFIKEELHIKYYGRYMDDSYLIHQSKEYLEECLARIEQKCRECGIELNQRKIKISRLSSTFPFLKVRFTLTESGAVVRRLQKNNIVRMRRKLKKMFRLCHDGILTSDDIRMSFRSWEGHAKQFDSYHTRCRMAALYSSLICE